ncbi:MAG: hypothetical protein EOM69_07300, partial [Clostridia bacterium]|nr:hypothetical protein [Clostridia bacterium]
MSIRQTQPTASPAPKRGSVLSTVAFALSGAAMTLLLSQGGSLLFISAGVALAFLACLIAAFRFSLPECLLRKPAPLSLALGVVLAGYTALLYRAEFTRMANEVIVGFLTKAHLVSLVNIVRAALPDIVCILALFALFTWFYLLSDAAARFVHRWIASSCRAERLYLLIGSAIAVVAIVLVYSQTTAFLGGGMPYDVVYTTDSGNLVSTNSFFFVNAYENDIRQPLFAVFSMPFAVVSMLLGKLLFFVPNAYMTVLTCVQAVLLLFGFTLFARVLGLDGTDRVLFLLLLAVSYPTLLFLFTVEQYVFSVFWVFVLLYVWHERECRVLPFVAASGSLLTSGGLLPLLLEGKSAKERARALLSGGLAFLAVFVVFARVPLLNRALQNAKDIASFAGEAVSLPNRALQFFAFVSACFARPAAAVDFATYTHASYQLLPVTGMRWLGFALFALALISAALNWRDRSLRVCSIWAAFSVLLLLVIGWGASENGMVLYTLYFFWAYVALLYALLKRVLRVNQRLRYVVVATVICILVFINAFGMLDLFR